jgi:hypothetical protein
VRLLLEKEANAEVEHGIGVRVRTTHPKPKTHPPHRVPVGAFALAMMAAYSLRLWKQKNKCSL